MEIQDPHPVHSSSWELYVFFIAAPVIVAVVFYFGVKLMNRLDKRAKRQDMKKEESSKKLMPKTFRS